MTAPAPDRYASQWADVIDAWRVAAFFTRAREGGR